MSDIWDSLKERSNEVRDLVKGVYTQKAKRAKTLTADDVPIGDGLANNAKEALKGRKKKLDDQIEADGG